MHTPPSADDRNIVVLALYQFVDLPDYREMRGPLLRRCQELELLGTLLLAHEGINGTVAGSREGIDGLRAFLARDGRFDALEAKESLTDSPPFLRMKVKLKKEIVTLGVPGLSPATKTGTRVAAKDWNALISDPEVILIDARNQYEMDIGTFHHAVSPETDTFREFPDFIRERLDPARDRKVAMFCTGGIRCEKASAYLLAQGFEQVFQLDGGILRYLEDIDSEQSLWQGECFVFDGRVSVDHNLSPGIHQQCFSCRHPVSPADMASEHYEEGVSCPHCHEQLTERKRQRLRERQRQVKLAEQRQQRHIGQIQPSKTKRKSGAPRTSAAS